MACGIRAVAAAPNNPTAVKRNLGPYQLIKVTIGKLATRAPAATTPIIWLFSSLVNILNEYTYHEYQKRSKTICV
jgi:hypothetical protein